jgi:Tol biopolymer transport system component
MRRLRSDVDRFPGQLSGRGLRSRAGAALLVMVSVLSGCQSGKDWASGRAHVTFDISPQGDSLVFNAEGNGGSDLYLLDLKRSQVTPLAISPGYEFDPTFSPDGKSIAFVARPPGDWGDHIFVQSIEGGSRKQLTTDETSDTCPTFSPDGSLLVFARSRTHHSGGLAADWGSADALCVMNVDGSSMRRIETDGLYVDSPRFSPDGRQIVFCDASGIYIVASDGSQQPRPVSILKGGHATFSPDGLWLLYTAGRYEADLAIFMARVDGSEVRHIVGSRKVNAKPSGGIYRPVFTPDGKRIVFLFHTWPDGPTRDPKWELWEVQREGGSPRKLANCTLFDEPLAGFPQASDGK